MTFCPAPVPAHEGVPPQDEVGEALEGGEGPPIDALDAVVVQAEVTKLLQTLEGRCRDIRQTIAPQVESETV